MRLESGRVLNLAVENTPVAGCTVSEQIYQANGMSVFVFSLAAQTDISAESYDYHKILMVLAGKMEVFTTAGGSWMLGVGDSVVTPTKVPMGMKSIEGCVYIEIGLRKDSTMNKTISSGNVFQLKDILPYQEGRIVNMDISSNDKMKFVLMSFDAGTGLSEHAAPGEALVFALDGEAVIGYEGEQHTIHAGETFKFDKMGRHSVTATKQFKMALLLVLE
ncbi:MAG: cupin domain-containing protein [Atopobiaceae bacterium]|jgi:quercetin dioxygenase-like cupin family protein